MAPLRAVAALSRGKRMRTFEIEGGEGGVVEELGLEQGGLEQGALELSMGMSEDFESAVRCGSDEVRVGSGVLGRGRRRRMRGLRMRLMGGGHDRNSEGEGRWDDMEITAVLAGAYLYEASRFQDELIWMKDVLTSPIEAIQPCPKLQIPAYTSTT